MSKITPSALLSREEERPDWILWTAFLVILAVSALIIANFTKPIVYDQVIATYRFESGYPNISSGIVSHLLIGLYNYLFHPAALVLNTHIKMFAMLLFMTSAFLLATSIFKNRWFTLLFLVILMASRYPFLWLSTELIVAALLFLSIWSMVKKHHPAIVALMLVLLCFSKPELVLITVIFLGYYGFSHRKNLRAIAILLICFIFFTALLLTPGLMSSGTHYFTGLNRSLFSFGQHYAALFSKHQLSPNPPDPWENYYKYIDANFNGAKNMMEVVGKYPLKYFDFVLLSFGHGMLKAMALLHLLLILAVWAVYRYSKDGVKWIQGEKLILFSFLGYIPLFLLSYPHIRYLARYYPLAIILLLMFVKRLAIAGENSTSKTQTRLLIALTVVLCAVLINIFLFANNLAGLAGVKDFWFPD